MILNMLLQGLLRQELGAGIENPVLSFSYLSSATD
jgi:hypothetical protein